jgi:hypothetical protein
MPRYNGILDWEELESSCDELCEYLTETYEISDIIQYLNASQTELVENSETDIDAWLAALDEHYGRHTFETAALDLLNRGHTDEDAVYRFIDDCTDMNTILQIMSAVVKRLLSGDLS